MTSAHHPDSDWNVVFIFHEQKSATSGELINGLVMARWQGGVQQFREMTVAEAADYVSSEAW